MITIIDREATLLCKGSHSIEHSNNTSVLLLGQARCSWGLCPLLHQKLSKVEYFSLFMSA
jgi:hypothetical protein